MWISLHTYSYLATAGSKFKYRDKGQTCVFINASVASPNWNYRLTYKMHGHTEICHCIFQLTNEPSQIYKIQSPACTMTTTLEKNIQSHYLQYFYSTLYHQLLLKAILSSSNMIRMFLMLQLGVTKVCDQLVCELWPTNTKGHGELPMTTENPDTKSM